MMKTAFMCSLIHKGVLGGAIYVKENTVSYRTQKLTVDAKYRNLVLPREEIQSLSWQPGIVPVAVFSMADGQEYKFLIFNKRRFSESYQALTSAPASPGSPR